MKKTLNNIFDEAKASELEVLLSKNPATDVSSKTLSSIKKRVYSKTEITKRKIQPPFMAYWRSYIAVAICIVLVLGTAFGTITISNLLGRVPPSQTLPQSDAFGSATGTPQVPGSSAPPAVSIPPFYFEQLNNGVLKDVSVKKMNIPVNMKKLGSTDISKENNSENTKATAVMYTLSGAVVNWITENDFIYIITKTSNRLVVIDSNSMKAVCNIPLAAAPAEIHIIDDRIYISLPDLCRIDVFSKADCEKKGSFYVKAEVSSFCIDGDYIYYTEHDQHCRIFKQNLITGAVLVLDQTFYFPKIILNKEDRILYVGETDYTGCAIYYYDADTLTLKSCFQKDDYGIYNHTRDLFHVGDYVFWGGYRISDTNAKELIGKYETSYYNGAGVDYGSMAFASEELVSTYEGLFLTDTYECIIDYNFSEFDFEYLIVSESYNVFFREKNTAHGVIIGVNFELQETYDPV